MGEFIVHKQQDLRGEMVMGNSLMSVIQVGQSTVIITLWFKSVALAMQE